MKFKSVVLLLSFAACSVLLIYPLGSVSTTSAQRDKVTDRNDVDSSQQSDEPVEGSVCGRPFGDEKEKPKLKEKSKSTARSEVQAYSLGAGSVTINVYFHVINRGTGEANGDVAEHRLDQQIAVLNDAFGGVTGGANTSFRFQKACVTRTNNATWYNMSTDGRTVSARERAAKTALHQGGATELNFYTINDTGSAWARFPWEYSSEPALDGIVVPHTMLPGGTRANFGDGDIAVHEVGHWLGLYHTYGSNCAVNADEVADTPIHLEPSSVVGNCPPPRDSCPQSIGLDPDDNFMTDTSDACKRKFTPGQSARMDNRYASDRQPFGCAAQCGVMTTASVAWIAPAENTWGQPNTLTAAGYAQNGCGNVQLVWRDTTIGGPWNVVSSQAVPAPDGTWSSTIASPYKCHNFEAYVQYSGVTSAVLPYNGVNLGYCDESVNLIWVQPAHSGTSGYLRVAGRALKAPPGTPVYVWYRNVTAGTGWVRHNEGAGTLPDGIWLLDIPNANFYHVYEVQAEYDVRESLPCTYSGNNSITWCQ
ncbi:MAG: zinc metalloprotease [Pyrinomonadaceae bacterium]